MTKVIATKGRLTMRWPDKNRKDVTPNAVVNRDGKQYKVKGRHTAHRAAGDVPYLLITPKSGNGGNRHVASKSVTLV